MPPAVSIVIPTRNGGPTLVELLDALERQDTEFAYETVAVDSGSADGTRELLARRADRVVDVPAAEFNHGTTRNLGVEAARGDLVVLLVQDAVPSSPGWLAALTAPFATDERLAGTFARQLPRPGASGITRHALARWVAAGDEPYTASVESPEAFQALAPGERFRLSVFDNVCSCLRRDVWRRHPFRPTPIAEDVEWSKEVLLAGYRLAYVPAAAVAHSHERSAFHELRRTYLVHRRLYELFEMRTVPTPGSLLISLQSTLADHLRCLARGEGPRPGPAEVTRTIALAFAWPLGQYLGGRAAARER